MIAYDIIPNDCMLLTDLPKMMCRTLWRSAHPSKVLTQPRFVMHLSDDEKRLRNEQLQETERAEHKFLFSLFAEGLLVALIRVPGEIGLNQIPTESWGGRSDRMEVFKASHIKLQHNDPWSNYVGRIPFVGQAVSEAHIKNTLRMNASQER